MGRLSDIEQDHKEFAEKHGIICDENCDDCWLINGIKATLAELQDVEIESVKRYLEIERLSKEVVHYTQGSHALCNLYNPPGSTSIVEVTCPWCLKWYKAIRTGRPI